jgi:hypothetical protein
MHLFLREAVKTILVVSLLLLLMPSGYAAALPGDSAEGKRLLDANGQNVGTQFRCRAASCMEWRQRRIRVYLESGAQELHGQKRPEPIQDVEKLLPALLRFVQVGGI